ncbi:MAG TPA: hypothetical protein VFP50_00575, partial [Anaeromyxobacteraceae bacterium]|nr:hypothetical protein [Anaeromyxobacteraceae bacterium]
MAKTHTDKAYEAELTRLREQLLEMGGLVEAAIAGSVRAVVERDAALAEQVKLKDLRDKLLTMGGKVEAAIAGSVRA